MDRQSLSGVITMRILVVDDDRDLLELMEWKLKKLGYLVETAHTAESGMKIFKEWKPELILLDVNLPDKNGLDVLKEIKAEDKKVPVVVVTAYKDAEKVIEAFRQGAKDCLLKPFDFEYLKKLILTNVEK